MKLLITLLLLPLLLAGCTVSSLESAVTTATGLTVTRHDAIVVANSLVTLSDFTTAVINGCKAANSFTGVCSERIITGAHNAVVASRKARDDLLSYADAHNDLPAGPGGAYELAVSAVADLQAAIAALGATPPPTPKPATGA